MKEFKYKPRIFYRGTQKYVFYQFFDDSTLVLPLTPTAQISTINNNCLNFDYEKL